MHPSQKTRRWLAGTTTPFRTKRVVGTTEASTITLVSSLFTNKKLDETQETWNFLTQFHFFSTLHFSLAESRPFFFFVYIFSLSLSNALFLSFLFYSLFCLFLFLATPLPFRSLPLVFFLTFSFHMSSPFYFFHSSVRFIYLFILLLFSYSFISFLFFLSSFSFSFSSPF